jgi:ribose/xylose/arabinose/galactoside ABC-type transport system permease subunit
MGRRKLPSESLHEGGEASRELAPTLPRPRPSSTTTRQGRTGIQQRVLRPLRVARPALIAFVILVIVGIVVNERTFVSGQNVNAVLLFWPVVALTAMGEGLALVSGGIDLSLEGVISLSGAVVMTLHSGGASDAVAVGAGLGAGLAAGLFNGLFISILRVPPLVCTLATLFLFDGIALYITRGNTAYGAPSILTRLADSWLVKDVPTVVVVGVLAGCLCGAWLYRTRTGVGVRVSGDSRRAARVLGVSRVRSLLWVYGGSALLFSVAGLVQMGQLNSYYEGSASTLMLPAVAAAVLGGAALDGGTVGVVGAAVGAMALALVQNVCDIAGLSDAAHQLSFGVVVALAIAIERGIAVGWFGRASSWAARTVRRSATRNGGPSSEGTEPQLVHPGRRDG